MTQRFTNRRRLAGYVATILLAFFVLRISAVQNVIADALIEFVEITEKTLRLPCALLDHDRGFPWTGSIQPVRRTCNRSTTSKEAVCRFNSRNIANGSSSVLLYC